MSDGTGPADVAVAPLAVTRVESAEPSAAPEHDIEYSPLVFCRHRQPVDLDREKLKLKDLLDMGFIHEEEYRQRYADLTGSTPASGTIIMSFHCSIFLLLFINLLLLLL